MRRIKQSQWLLGLATLMVVAVAALSTIPAIKDKAMNTASADSPMHTLCVGRHLIDVPANYKFEHYNYRIDGMEIMWLFKAKDRASFDAALNGRKAELWAERNDFDKPSLEAPQEHVVKGMSVVILPYGRINPVYLGQKNIKSNPDGDRYLEAWVWTGKHGYKFDGKDLGPGGRPEQLIRRINSLEEIEFNATPAEEGFCMEMFDARAMIAGPPRAPDTYEGAEIQFGLTDHADVKFRLSFYPNLNDKLSEPLFAREAKAAENLKQSAGRFKKLRHQRRTVHGMDGEEIVEAVHERNGTRSHSFDWEWLGRVKDPLAPQIELEAKTGYSNEGPVDSSLSDESALKLWDAIVDSIRLRPATAAKTSQAAPEIPLGELAATGRICPATGWWDCAEVAAPVQGGRRQFFHAGDPMPGVVLLGKPGLLQRLKGDVPTYRTATVWELVEYGAPPATPADKT